VTAWVNQVNLAQMSAQDKSKKAVALQALISAFGRVRTVAKDIELLLRAREQRDAVPANVAAAPSPPQDTLALPLWHAFELARLIKLVADTAELAADDVKALQKRIKHHVAGVTVRDTGAVDEFKRRHRISNVADAVASYEQVQAQLAEEALTERDAIEARDDLIAFGKFMSSEFIDPWHIQVIADALMRVERGEVSGLVLNVPPRHGKTQLASILFAAWYCGRHPSLLRLLRFELVCHKTQCCCNIARCRHHHELCNHFGIPQPRHPPLCVGVGGEGTLPLARLILRFCDPFVQRCLPKRADYLKVSIRSVRVVDLDDLWTNHSI
jgi:hypothetical protein